MAYIDIALKKSFRGTIETNGSLKWVSLYVDNIILYYISIYNQYPFQMKHVDLAPL